MEREKPTFDILGRIEQERLSRGWSEYALAENSGLTQSTISTWRRRNLQPNVASLEKICSGLGISLSQFFQEEDSARTFCCSLIQFQRNHHLQSDTAKYP